VLIYGKNKIIKYFPRILLLLLKRLLKPKLKKNKTKIMPRRSSEKICRVCGDIATGNHYGKVKSHKSHYELFSIRYYI